MPNPPGPDHGRSPNHPVPHRDTERSEHGGPGSTSAAQPGTGFDEEITDVHPVTPGDADSATEVFHTGDVPMPPPAQQTPERRFTAPGFDAGQTEIIHTVPEAPTEVFDARGARRGRPSKAKPQLIPPRLARRLPTPSAHNWGWVLALVLIVLALAVIAVLGTVWLTRDSRARASQEEAVRSSIENYDIALQNGDLAALRGMTCGAERDNYLNYNEQSWDDTYRRIAAAKRYPVVASIDQLIVNGERAEANVTAFMAYAPNLRSTRSIDLQYRDDQWKICQTRTE